jgi:hypothetical protein
MSASTVPRPILIDHRAQPLSANCDLPAEIHATLVPENWHAEDFKQDAKLWNDLQPALRLSTQILNSDRTLLWFSHLIFGEEKRDTITKKHFLEETENSWNPDILEDVKCYLSERAAARIKLEFSDKPNTVPCCDGMTLANHPVFLVPLSLRAESAEAVIKVEQKVELVALRLEFKEYFQSGQRCYASDVSTSWHLAVTIVHEIAHVVGNIRKMERDALLGNRSSGLCSCGCWGVADEPFFRQCDSENELGWSLETYLFGLKFIATRMSVTHGSENLVARFIGTSAVHRIVVSETFLSSFFQRPRWERIPGMVAKDSRQHPTIHRVSQRCRSDTLSSALVRIVRAILIHDTDSFLLTI